MAFNVTARTVPCSLNCSLAVFVPRETQCQGELTDPVEVRKSASQRRCDPATEQKEGSWVKETFPSYLAPSCASLTRRDTQVYAPAASRDRLRACHSVLQHRIPAFPVGGRSSTLWLRTWTQTAWVRSLAPPLPADLGQGAKASAAASVQWGQGHWQPQEVFSENFRRYILCHEQFVLCPLVLLCLSF